MVEGPGLRSELQWLPSVEYPSRASLLERASQPRLPANWNGAKPADSITDNGSPRRQRSTYDSIVNYLFELFV